MTEAAAKTRKEEFMAGFKLGYDHASEKAMVGEEGQLPADATERFAQGYKCGQDECQLERSYYAQETS